MPFSELVLNWRRLEVVLLFPITATFFPVPVLSLPRDVGDGPERPFCEPEVSLQLRISTTGLPLVGNTLKFDALSSKIVIREPAPDAPASCDVRYLSLAAFGNTAWTIVDQPGNTALADVTSLSATLPIDRAGLYRILFEACPDGCDVPVGASRSMRVAGVSRSIHIDAVDEIAVQPETEPVLPDLPATESGTFPGSESKCQAASSVINPAWVTVDPWHGADDYQLLEGFVSQSHISRKDSPLNHDSQDAIFKVIPDPPYRFLKTEDDSRIEVEWERDHFPENFRPTQGDRVSVVGYWIHDCSHGRKTEIHPPVMVAVHRPRAVEIPVAAGLGENIRVPGIVTHIWVNRDAGEVTRNCSLTGLHQPNGGAGFDFGPHACLPQTEGFDRNPINAVYEFSIYLPEDPRAVLAKIAPDANPPEVPIHTEVVAFYGDQSAFLDVTVDPETKRFIRVRLDLSEYSGRSFAARIDSAWALPSPDNWDLRKWRVSVDAVDVTNDGDFGGRGEWRLWFNTLSTDQEWTPILHRSLGEGRKTFGGIPFQTGHPNPARSLGSDLLLFPGQRIWVHSGGFEDDALWSDSTGQVNMLKPQTTSPYREKSRCKDSGQSNCAAYTLEYAINDLGPFGSAELTQRGRELFDAFTIRLSPTVDVGRYTRLFRTYHHPNELILTEENPTVRLSETGLLRTQGVEPISIGDIGAEEFTDAINELAERGPERLNEFLGELRDEVLQMADQSDDDDLGISLASLKNNLPPVLWKKHFADLQDTTGDTNKPGEFARYWLIVIVFVLLVLAIGFVRRKARRMN